MVPSVQPGSIVAVRVDETNPQRVAIDFEHPQADLTAGSSSGDALSKLERLAALHEQGALTDEEFAEQKRRLLDET